MLTVENSPLENSPPNIFYFLWKFAPRHVYLAGKIRPLVLTFFLFYRIKLLKLQEHFGQLTGHFKPKNSVSSFFCCFHTHLEFGMNTFFKILFAQARLIFLK